MECGGSDSMFAALSASPLATAHIVAAASNAVFCALIITSRVG